MEGVQNIGSREEQEQVRKARDAIFKRNWQRLPDGTWYNPLANEWITSYENLVLVCTGGRVTGGIVTGDVKPEEVVENMIKRMELHQ